MRTSVMVACLIACAALTASCRSAKTITKEVPVYIHDTVKDTKEVHDSTYVDRWHTEYVKGDTVYVTNNQITVKYRTVTDTSYKVIEKPVEVVVDQIKEVEKKLNWAQKTLMWLGGCFILAAVAFGIHRMTKKK